VPPGEELPTPIFETGNFAESAAAKEEKLTSPGFFLCQLKWYEPIPSSVEIEKVTLFPLQSAWSVGCSLIFKGLFDENEEVKVKDDISVCVLLMLPFK
jgi:hypothetical protein